MGGGGLRGGRHGGGQGGHPLNEEALGGRLYRGPTTLMLERSRAVSDGGALRLDLSGKHPDYTTLPSD
eukprot:5238878-Prymnesium_polylepis.1